MSREAKNEILEPIQGMQDLLSIFQNGARKPENFVIGLEVELLGTDETGRALSFEGAQGIESVLVMLSEKYAWEQVRNGDRTIGLLKGKTAITIEPGGQLELSSRPHANLSSLHQELSDFISSLLSVSIPKNINWVTVGLHPLTTLDEMKFVPKYRYGIMRKYYEARPGLPLEMMGRTASIQVNLDYLSEKDAAKKIHLGAAIGPVVGAMFANSAVEKGKLNGYCSRRMAIWRKTDPDRSGIQDFFVDGSFSFERYAEYALNVPMYFILRNGEYVDRAGTPFRQFMKGTVAGDVASLSDWESHLTTLFPDVRLKNHLEFRTADENRPELMLAVVAFWIGLLHDADSLGAALSRVESWRRPEIETATDDAAIKGLAGTIAGEPILKVARDLVEISVQGLSRIDRITGDTNLMYVNPLRDLVETGFSPAEVTRKTFSGDFSGFLKLNRLRIFNEA